MMIFWIWKVALSVFTYVAYVVPDLPVPGNLGTVIAGGSADPFRLVVSWLWPFGLELLPVLVLFVWCVDIAIPAVKRILKIEVAGFSLGG
jgi:hypothetical protein